MLNDRVEQEIEALQAIFGEDFDCQEIRIKEAWKDVRMEKQYRIKLTAKTENLKGLVAVLLCFQFPKTYPDTLPIFSIKKIKGLNDQQLKRIQNLVSKKARESIGMEMIYDIASAVEEFISDHNSVLSEQVSAFELMHDRLKIKKKNQLEIAKELEIKEQIKKQEEDKIEDEALMKKIQQEIAAKEAKLNQKSEIIPCHHPEPQNVNFKDIIIPPLKSDQKFSEAWTADGTRFTVFTCEVKQEDRKLIQKNIDIIKALKHSGISSIKNFDFSKKNGVIICNILIEGLYKISLPDLINLSGAIEIKKAKSAIEELLLLLDDLYSVGVTFDEFKYDLIMFRDDMALDVTLLIADAFINNEFPVITSNRYVHWAKPDKANKMRSVGSLFFFMIFGQHIEQLSISHCISICIFY